jgi:hypothetical protein
MRAGRTGGESTNTVQTNTFGSNHESSPAQRPAVGPASWTPRFEESTWVRRASFTLMGNTMVGLNVLGAVSRKLFANALVPCDNDSETLQANIRIDWIHTPESDLLLVLNDGYFQGDFTDPREERWVNRTGVVMLTYRKAF